MQKNCHFGSKNRIGTTFVYDKVGKVKGEK